MSGKPTTRFTIYAVARGVRTFTARDGIPYAHCHDEAAALTRCEVIATEGFAQPTRVVERERAYPFKVVRVVWALSDSQGDRVK